MPCGTMKIRSISFFGLALRGAYEPAFALVILTAVLLGACTTTPLQPYTEDTPPLILMPATQAGVVDKRGRFREIFCAILEKHGKSLPDYRSCNEALTRVGDEPEGTGKKVDLGPAKRPLKALIVPGVGWDCFSDWLDLKNTVNQHLRQFGYDVGILRVDSLASSTHNARQIRDAIMAMDFDSTEPDLVLIGYSKGAPDILEAVVAYPEIRQRVAAVVSMAGSVGGSPLANDAAQSQLEILKHWPGAQCTDSDHGALESLRPEVREKWLATHPLPQDIPYYSLVTYPEPDRISSILKSSYKKLSRIDARNDSQMIFYDQIIPGSTLLGFANADHWALAVPIARSHSMIGSTFVNHNDYPREALLEAIMRFVEEDLEKGQNKH